MVSENIWQPKNGEMRGWRKLHNEELHSLYSSSDTTSVTKGRCDAWGM